MPIKLSARQQNVIYWAGVVQELRAAGKYAAWEIKRMIVQACEYSESMGQSDVSRIFEIADGVRCA